MPRPWSTALCRTVLCFFLAATGVAPVHAVSTYWQHDPTTPGDWFDAANWTNGVPESGSWRYSYVTNGGTARVADGIAFGGTALYLGYGATESGTIELLGLGQLSADAEIVGYNGTGEVVQTGGTNTIEGTLFVGLSGTGSYRLSQAAGLSAGQEYVGHGGIGHFLQTAGTNSVTYGLQIGYLENGDGTYELSGGELSVGWEEIGSRGTGRFVHTGGINTIQGRLCLGHSYGAAGIYELSGDAELSAATLIVGRDGTADLRQSGGSLTTGYLHVSRKSGYSFSGGTLHISDNGALDLAGILDFRGAPATISAGEKTFLDFSRGQVLASSQVSLEVGPNSLTVFPVGFDPSLGLGSFTTQGIAHTVGTELVVAAGQGFMGAGIINDHVRCAGTIQAPDGQGLDLRGGVTLLEEGYIDLGKRFYYVYPYYLGGRLTVSKGVSGISGGRLRAETEYIGGDWSISGSVQFVQTGGLNEIVDKLYLAYGNGSNVAYQLSGDGQLSAKTEVIGRQGIARFIQSGGTNTVVDDVLLASSADGEADYELSDDGRLTAKRLSVGAVGTGRFVQTGGFTTLAGELYLGQESGASGVYELRGSGQLSAAEEYVGVEGTAEFLQNGGANTVGYLSVGSQGQYVLTGGSLLITDQGAVQLYGVLDLGNSTASISAGQDTFLDFSRGTLSGSGQASLNVGLNSLTIFPPGTNPDTAFASFTTGGLFHTAGSELVIAAGQGFSGFGAIDDHVRCAATISVPAGRGLDLRGGLTLLGEGHIELGDPIGPDGSKRPGGTLIVNDDISGISGGFLSALSEFIGGVQSAPGTGRLSHSGGTNLVRQQLAVGQGEGSVGTYELSGDGYLTAKDVSIGPWGTGRFIQTGGTSSIAGSLTVEGTRAGVATYELSGTGTLLAGNEYVGGFFDGTGRFIQTGGENRVSGTLYLGRGDGVSTYELGGTGQLSAASIHVGYQGSESQFTQLGGANAISGGLYVGGAWYTTGTYELRSGANLSADQLVVGGNGTGQFIHNGGMNAIHTRLDLGLDSNGSGTYRLSGDARLEAAKQNIGYSGIGRFIQTGGTNTASEGLAVGVGPSQNGEGTYELSGTGTVVAAREWIGYQSPGKLIQSGGINTIAEGLSVGYGAGRAGERTYQLDSGQLQTGWEVIGQQGKGRFVQTGGQNSIRDGLDLGLGKNGDGTYELSGTGKLSARFQNVGNQAFGRFLHSGGLNAISEKLHLGLGENGRGIYELSGTGQLSAADEYVGDTGIGRLTQTGGANSISGVLSIAPGPDSDGTYELGGSGRLSANWQVVGGYGVGRFIHTGGNNTIVQDLSLGQATGGDGTYQLSGSGQLSAYFEAVGEEGTGRFIQSGGTNSVQFVLRLAGWEGSNGTYELSGNGRLSAEFELVGSKGVGHFIHSSGINTVLGDLSVGHDTGDGTYHLSATGGLSANNEFIGFAGTGRFVQTGGGNAIRDTLAIGYQPGSHGTYTISAGSLSTGGLSVNYGTLEIADPAAQVTVSNRLSFGAEGNLTAVPGATIHMTGSALENKSTDAAALAGLGNLRLIFDGGSENVDPVEIAGRDLGPVLEGFQGNFALGTLQLGGTEVGKIRLVDDFDNQPGWDGKEALYVWNLSLGPSSYLDLNGLKLYCFSAAIDPAATVTGGVPTIVPEPSALALSVLGTLLLLTWTRRRPKKPG
jgi:hypothetical protein